MNRVSTLLSTLTLIMLTLATTTTMRAQDDEPPLPPCNPDCYEVQWGPAQKTRMQVWVCDVPCNVEVTFHTRNGMCNGLEIHDFQVTQVELLDQACSRFCNPDQYLAQVTLYMLLFNPMQFPTIRGECVTNWRASLSSCQMRWRSYKTGKTYVVKCGNTAQCCLATYQVCFDATSGAVSSINLVYPPEPSAGCPPAVGEGVESSCQPACNALTDLIDPYGKRSLFETANDATVAPNPATEAVTITATTDAGAQIMLYDLRGRAMLHQLAEPPAGDRYTFTLDLREIPAGTYYFVVKGNDATPGSIGTLTVTK